MLLLVAKIDLSLKDFRPIALCNVLYNICSKILANQLKKILPHIIFERQPAFVPGRLIIYNFLVTFETIHYMKNKKRGQTSFCALKLDITKGYDRVSWEFLEAMMLRLGFSTKWVGLDDDVC